MYTVLSTQPKSVQDTKKVLNILGAFIHAVSKRVEVSPQQYPQYRQKVVRFFYDRRKLFYIFNGKVTNPNLSRPFARALDEFPAARFYDDVVNNLGIIDLSPKNHPNRLVDTGDGRMSCYATQWLLLSALHPDHEVELEVADLLRKYLEPFYRHWRSSTDVLYQMKMLSRSKKNTPYWPGMNGILSKAFARLKDETDPFTEDNLYHILAQLIRLGCWVADVYRERYETITNYPEDYVTHVARDYIMGETGRFQSMLEDPFAETNIRARELLSQMNVSGNIDFLSMIVVSTFVRLDRAPSGRLIFMVYQWILQAATNTRVDDGTVLRIVKDRFDACWERNIDDVPIYWRPSGCPNEIGRVDDEPMPTNITNNNVPAPEGNTFNPIGLPLPEEVPVYPIGPRNDVMAISMPYELSPGQRDICVICQDEFEESGASCVKANGCRHLFHFACLDALANDRAYPSDGKVPCPICRASICDSRDYRGIAEDSD
ncbi:hypothetical protein CC80DRAFT_554152 [Byssothecium circinans]|uniref:RING-type domain-containing protein n=1 Tax=Byssothecium circinans TaxID=147558 RepID=A0A6A5TG27_9PLEO|nr:hypothetical protein CC80DRAFT_554152 [Byssothecium circinans]